jgi:NAD dependent epimerase/dehydratase family enzyme
VLGGVLNRPSILPLPSFAARLALGEMADALLLSSSRVRPAALQALGYEWRCPGLSDAIRQAID